MNTTRPLAGSTLSTDARRVHVLHGVASAGAALDQTWVVDRELALGREGDGLCLPDSALSRRHARFRLSDRADLVLLEDTDSRNGTFVGGARVTARVLVPGDVIRLGETVLVYDTTSEQESSATVAGYIGRSSAAAQLRGELELAARSGLSVLLVGPTGAGKEVAAAALHRATGRAGPLIAVNCAALPRELVESALFGHKKGAFSGAAADAEGYFRAADGGTLFLDEVAELDAAAQAALLRVLEDHIVVPVGATRGHPVDVQVVSATNADLASAVASGAFREDLLMRLGGWAIGVPPLAARRADIFDLARRFLGRPAAFAADAVEALLLAAWPGNARELRAVVTQAAARARGQGIALEHLPAPLQPAVRERTIAPAAATDAFRRPDREELLAALARHDGRVADVAEQYGRTRKQIYRWMDQYEIPRARRDGGPSD